MKRPKPRENRHINVLGFNSPYDAKQVAEFNRQHDLRYGFDMQRGFYTHKTELPVFRGKPDFSRCKTRDDFDRAIWAAHNKATAAIAART